MATWAKVVASGSGEAGTIEDSISDEEIAEAEELVRDNHILISEESNPGCFSKWKFGLVGRFLSGSKPIDVIKAALSYYWGKHRCFEILQAKENAWLLLFENEADLEWALHNGPWAVCGRILFLEKWEQDFNFNSRIKTMVPVWLLLPDLPKKLLSRSAIIALAARVGRPLFLDSSSLDVGSRKCVRVKVNCDIATPLLEGFNIVINGFSIWQKFRYEGFTRPCAKCGLIGHSTVTCSGNNAVEPRGRSVVSRGRKRSSRGFSRVKNNRRDLDDAEAEVKRLGDIEGSVRVEQEGQKPTGELGGTGSEEVAVEAGSEGELYVILTGAEEAAPDAQSGQFEGELVFGASSPKGAGEGFSKLDSDLSDSASDEDLPPPKVTFAEKASSSKAKESRSCNKPARETRRNKLGGDDLSASDFFRNAGAMEGVKVKASKASKGGKPSSAA